jgi:hypothetical protein
MHPADCTVTCLEPDEALLRVPEVGNNELMSLPEKVVRRKLVRYIQRQCFHDWIDLPVIQSRFPLTDWVPL